MSKFATVVLALFVAVPAFAADPAPSCHGRPADCLPATPPAVPVQGPVMLEAGQMAMIAEALNIAASTCATNTDGCAIGLNKTAVLLKLQAARNALPVTTH